MAAEAAAIMQMFLDGKPESFKQAEQALLNLTIKPGFAHQLCEMGLNTSYPEPVRQLAAVMLKNVINDHWLSTADTAGIPDDEKAAIRGVILRGLYEASHQLRTSFALVVATIARYDWPESWSDLFEQLVDLAVPGGSGAKSGNPHVLDGAMRCLSLFVDEVGTDHIETVIQHLKPHIIGFVTNRATSTSPCYWSLRMVRSGLLTVRVILGTKAGKAAGKRTVVPLFSDLYPHCKAILGDGDLSPSGLRLKTAAVQLVKLVVEDYEPLCKAAFPDILASLVGFMSALSPVYIDLMVRGTADDRYGSAVDFDGEPQNLHQLATQVVECVETFCRVDSKKNAKVVEAALPQITQVLIDYAQMTQSQLEEWEDPAAFIEEEEDDDTQDVNPRMSSGFGAWSIAECFGKKGMETVLTAVAARVGAAPPGSSPDWWKVHEATMLLIGRMSKTMSKYNTVQSKKGKRVEFDLPQYMAYLCDMMSRAREAGEGGPYLAGRALWCGSKLAPGADEATCKKFFEIAVAGLATPEIPVRVAACQALCKFLRRLPQADVLPHLPSIVEQSATLVTSAGPEVLHLTLGTLVQALKVAPNELAGSQAAPLSSLFVALWLKYIVDPFHSPLVSESLAILIRNPLTVSVVCGKLVPVVGSILSNPTAQPSGVVNMAVELLRGIVEKSGSPLPEELMRLFGLVVCNTVSLDDNSVVQSCCDCLAAFVHVAAPQISAWSGAIPGRPSAASGPEAVIAAIGATLAKPSDSANLYTGKLIMSLVDKWSILSPEMIQTIAARMHSARIPACLVAFVLVFAHLILKDEDPAKGILAHLAAGRAPAPPAWTLPAYRVDEDTGSGAPSGVVGVGLPAAAGGGGGASLAAGTIEPGPDGSPCQSSHYVGGAAHGTPQSLLESLLICWAYYQEHIHGEFERKLSSMALCRVLLDRSVMASVQHITVRGDRISGPEGSRYSTRRADGQVPMYKAVPLPVRLVAQVAKTLQTEVEQDEEEEWNSDFDDDDDDDDDDDGWGDDDDEDDFSGVGFVDPGVGGVKSSPFAFSEDVSHLADMYGDGGEGIFAGMYAGDSDSDIDEDEEYNPTDSYLGAKDHPVYSAALADQLKGFLGAFASSQADVFRGAIGTLSSGERDFIAAQLGGASPST